MHGRYLRASGLVLASVFAVWTSAFAQAPAAGAATGAQNPAATAPARGQRPPQPQSPTFARIQARTYDFKEAGMPMPYEVYIPTKYSSAQPAPLIIALHGLGSNPTQVIRYQGLTDLAEERGYIVAAPMGYNSGGWYGSRGSGRPPGRGGRGNQTATPENLGELSELDVMNVLGFVRKEFNVDPSRIYLFGHSMGGGGTYHIGMKHSQIWAALAPAAPAIYTSENGLEAIKGTPIIVVQGDNDNLVDVTITRRWIEKMKSLGMKYEYIEVPGGDHTGVIARTPANMKRIFDFFDGARK